MKTYTITLTDAEVKAMEFVAFSVQDWAENALKNRARIAMDEIYQAEIARMTADSNITSIPADKDVVILAADIKSAAQRQAEEEVKITEDSVQPTV